MKDKFAYIPKDERKKILLLCDDLRMHAGIATMAREFVIGSAQHFNWFQLGAAVQHNEKGKVLDLSDDINKQTGLEDSDVKIMPNNGYGDAQLVRALIKNEKPDAIFIFTDIFKPLDKTSEEYTNFRNEVLGGKDYKYVVYFNSRNIHRKRPGDVLLSYRLFCDKIGKEKAKDCVLIMHTAARDPHGTDLRAVKEALCDPSYVNVLFSEQRINPAQMNGMYNIADVTMLISSNEGWGLSLTESMVTGTMIIPAVTGGMQDQCRFEDENGDWVKLSPEFPSNHRGTYKKCGEWAVPVFPSNISLAGSVPTPYIFDDRVSAEDVADALVEVYNLPKEERERRGEKGRQWATSEEAGFTGKEMSKSIIKYIDKTIDNFVPRSKFDIVKADTRPSKYVEHKLTGY